MGWLNGYAAKWRVCAVDERTWADSSDVTGVRSVSVSRSCEADVPLLEEGQMTATRDFASGWCRIYMYADGMREAIATLLFEESRESEGGETVECSGYSVLKPCDDMRMASFTLPYAPAGSDGAEWAGDILSHCTPAPVEVDCSFTLNDDYVFDPGHTCLEEVWGLLDAGGCCIQVDGDGTIKVTELPTEPDLVLDSTTVSLVISKAEANVDYNGIPNRYYATDGTDTSVAVNDDPTSPVGYPQRGRWVDAYDSSPVLVNGETLEAYAERRLAEESEGVARAVEYRREYWPGVVPFSVVAGRLPDAGIDGDMRVMAQKLDCGKGIVVTESAVQEVSYL